MNNFQRYRLDIYTSEYVKIDFFESIERTILLCQISGQIKDGSAGFTDCSYIKQQLGLALLTYEPIGIIMDLRELCYSFGNSIIEAFRPISEIDIFNGEGFHTVYILSDKNKYGLSSIWCFDISNPRENIFYNFDEGYNYLITQYDK